MKFSGRRLSGDYYQYQKTPVSGYTKPDTSVFKLSHLGKLSSKMSVLGDNTGFV